MVHKHSTKPATSWGIFRRGGYSLHTCRLDEPWGSAQVFSAPTFPQKPCLVQEPASLMPLTLRWSILLGGCSSIPVGPDPKPKEMVVTILNYTPNSKCPHKSCCLSRTVDKPSRSPDRAPARRCRHQAWGPRHPHHSFC